MLRRGIITLLGGMAARPIAARAQQALFDLNQNWPINLAI
jgi:hypothetical protein